MKKLKPGKEATGKFLVRTSMYLHELAALSGELKRCVLNKISLTLNRESGILESLRLTNGEGFTGLARAIILWNYTARTRVLLRNQGKFGYR